jgi:hypothetical protein
MKQTITGIILFLLQTGLAIFYNATPDLIIIATGALITFAYIIYKYKKGIYDSCGI